MTHEKTGQAGRGSPSVLKVALVVGVVILLGWAWSCGTFDRVLVNVGLNAQPCIQLYYGQTLCGAAARDFCTTNYNAQYNGKACDEVLGR